MPTFADMNIPRPLLQALDDLGYAEPTAIQEQVYPVALSGRDVLGIARTGTGKTFAYLLPCLRQWRFTKDKQIQILILVPTRELVLQVVEEARRLSAYQSVVVAGVYGGVPMAQQMGVVRDGCDVLVATPGRLMDFLLKGSLRMKALRMLVIDEVDEMLALGLRHQIAQLLDLLPERRQSLMFSATLPPDVAILARQYFREPVMLSGTEGPPPEIALHGYAVPNFYTKVDLLRYLLERDATMAKVLVFAETRKLADLLADRLSLHLEDTLGVIHANKAQQHRFLTVRRFEEGALRVLIATDVVARGIDMTGVTHVVNFHLPDQAETFIHRIGRTGRSGESGVALCLVSEAEQPYLEAIEAFLGRRIPLDPLPDAVPVSSQLLQEEKPFYAMKAAPVAKDPQGGGAFHEKLARNQKVNNPNRWKEKMKLKYKKPKTRGQKKK